MTIGTGKLRSQLISHYQNDVWSAFCHDLPNDVVLSDEALRRLTVYVIRYVILFAN